MNCPKCNAKMCNNCCIGCGYMSNGNYVNKTFQISKFEDLKVYNNSFEEMMRNEKSYIPFLLGAVYFSYRNHFLFGILIGIGDILLSSLVVAIFNELLLPCYCFYLLTKRLMYMIFANLVCLKLDSYKVKNLKKYNKNFYKIISMHEDKNIVKLLFHIILYFMMVLLIMIYR